MLKLSLSNSIAAHRADNLSDADFFQRLKLGIYVASGRPAGPSLDGYRETISREEWQTGRLIIDFSLGNIRGPGRDLTHVMIQMPDSAPPPQPGDLLGDPLAGRFQVLTSSTHESGSLDDLIVNLAEQYGGRIGQKLAWKLTQHKNNGYTKTQVVNAVKRLFPNQKRGRNPVAR